MGVGVAGGSSRATLPAGGVWRKFKVPGDFQYPPAGSVLCAFCTQPAHGDEPLLKCCGLRDGNTCKLAWHLPCHEAVSGTAGCVVSGALLTMATLLLLTGSVAVSGATSTPPPPPECP